MLGTLASWLIKTGDQVNADQILASIETDKVTVDVKAPTAGKITKTFAAAGDEVQVGNPLFTMVAGKICCN